ncbi:ABC transporter substrate-binding protein [Candidatus Berkelbacteria bacterium]|nr:ABC transporter substrate-binding protein [Candidatus Berkelbacteria bacterium]
MRDQHRLLQRPTRLALGLATIAFAVGVTFVSCKDQESSRRPIVIGHQADLSGAIASWGYWLERAAQSAVSEINAKGGIDGRPIEYVVEDTQTNAAMGVRRLRKLILEHHADFVIGSVHSGVMMASLPIAKELKTPYFPVGMASEATAEEGNRYVYRISSHVREQIAAGADWALKNIAKRWTIVVSDYAWGWSHEKWFSDAVKGKGGTVLSAIRVPTGTKDFFPYLAKIPKDTEALYFIFFGADSIGFLQQLHESGYGGKKYTVVCTLEAIDIASLGEAAEGTWLLEYLPRDLTQYDTQPHRSFRDAVGIDAAGRGVQARDRVAACSHCWATYELVYLIKKTVEESGWKGKEDTPKFVEKLESFRLLQASREFPQGDNALRREDHQGFHTHWMSRVIGGKLVVQFEVPKEATIYPSTVDFTKEAF